MSVWQVNARDAQQATIRCDGNRRSASGFWRDNARQACVALASVRGALLAGPGCRRLVRAQVRLRAVGHFGTQRFDHRAQRAACPDTDAWLAVNVLAAPVTRPDRELDKPR